MKLTISKDANINYLARIIKLDDSNFSKHPNADKLQLINIYGNTISTDINSKPGYYVYFPVECVISPEFLKFHNLYRDFTLNNNPEQKGFFEIHGRVKCVKLRGIASEGFIMPINSLYSFINKPESSTTFESLIDKTFDTINNIKLVWKYTPPIKKGSLNGYGSSQKKAEIINKIVDNQFRYHIDTAKLQDNIYNINPNNLIQISIKEHGTSAIFSNLLVKKELSFVNRIIKKLGVPIIDSEYQIFCSSRKVIKDPILNPRVTLGFYNYDIWSLALEVVKNHLEKGQTVYAEIVGYLPTGNPIQGRFDYGCVYDPKVFDYKNMSALEMYIAGLFNIIIYRITTTNIEGKVFEYSTKQVQEWCVKHNLNPVKELYYGKAKDLFNIDTQDEWNEAFIAKLREQYLEKDSIICENKVPEEGIVLRKETLNIEVYKLKSLRFLEFETKMLDKGEVDIESNQNE